MNKFFYLIFIIIIGIILSSCLNNKNMNSNKKTRLPAKAGQFYPASADELKETINSFLEEARIDSSKNTRAIIVPHAGYPYSGVVAAHAFKKIKGRKIKRVILIGNSHTGYFDGVVIDENDLWQTPLGEIETDKELAKKLVLENGFINFDSQAHRDDHVLEVELPFLQIVLEGEFKIVPMLFGNSHGEIYNDLALVLADILEEDDLIVISSDMSHYPPYEEALEIDNDTLLLIKRKDIEDLDEHIVSVMSMNIPNEDTLICGPDAIKTVMELANQFGWQGEVLKYLNSGDVSIGDKEAVVGYGAISFAGEIKKLSKTDKIVEGEVEKEKTNVLNERQKNRLLEIARETVESFVLRNEKKDFKVEDKRLSLSEGAFVTLHKKGNLRGCIGQIISPNTPLWQNIRDMAISASSQDSRFSPVTSDELSFLDYEISVLSQPEAINDWKEIKLGEHGVIISKGISKGVFLPQVADETGWDLEEFLGQLCSQKAGLPADCYKNDSEVKIEIFTAQVFSDKGPK